MAKTKYAQNQSGRFLIYSMVDIVFNADGFDVKNLFILLNSS